ncbi:hypothetical protein [Mesobacillus foraminis]|uniref:hypothetical protein n=1 Tax=Mesobacillus foraminis TaxID=279826 RepID=UPI0013CF1E87|nr:hypothetical protein [Mesobacillus foraminis]
MLIDHEKQLDHVECLLFLKEIGRLINDYKLCKNKAVQDVILSEIKFLCSFIQQENP